MQKLTRRFAALSLIFLASPLQAAEVQNNLPAESSFHLEELIQYAVQHNSEITAARSEWLAAKKRIWIDTSLPDPVVEIAPGSMTNRYGVMQAVPFIGKLVLQGKMASKEAQAAYFRHQATERDIRLKVAESYYDLYFADASIQVIEEVRTLLKRFESVASTRYANRSGSQRDVAKMQAEVSLSLEKLYQLEQQRENTVAILNAVLNRDPMAPAGRAILPAKPVFKYTVIEAVNLAIQNRQEIREAEEVVKKSTYAKRLARLNYIPDLDIGFEYEDAKEEETEDEWWIPIKFNIPLWQNRVIPEIQEAKHLEDASKAKLIQVRNTAYQEVKEAFYRFEAAMKIADLYELAVIPQAQIALNADLAGYESGETDFLNLLDSERVYLGAKLSHIQFYTEALKAYVDLLRCCGLDFILPPEGIKNESK